MTVHLVGFHLNETRLCPQFFHSYINNLTLTYYTDQSKVSNIVPTASAVLFVLAGLIFNLKLFSSISDVSAILDPKARFFISPALSLFLPVTSYIFAKANNPLSCSTAAAAVADLSPRAGLILTCMFLVELLRSMVEEIRMGGYSSTIQRAGRVIWMGSLVFFNIQNGGRKAVFSILWLLCATKMAQRIAFSEVWKRSYANRKNASVLTSYMAKMLLIQRHERRLRQEHHHHHPDPGPGVEHDDVEQCPAPAQLGGNELMKKCNYIVMGEYKLVKEATADGYRLNEVTSTDGVITVGKVWEELPETSSSVPSGGTTGDLLGTRRLKRLCLSFALFKLLCRRFEHLQEPTEEEARDCRNLIVNGLCAESNAAEALFQVMSDEVRFLSEYYNSFIPVVFASPFFLLVNYFLVPMFVAVLCLMTIVICCNGDVGYALESISRDNYTLSYGISELTLCLVARAVNINDLPAFLSLLDHSVTFFLFLIFCYAEIWEFLVFLLSNWFMVSVLCSYTSKPQWRDSPCLSRAFRSLLWLRSKMNRANNLRPLKQFSLLNLRWPLYLPLLGPLSLAIRTESAPNSLKQSIMDCLVEHERHSTPLTNGKAALDKHHLSTRLAWACMSDSVTEVILTWHIATSILEVMCAPRSVEEVAVNKVATRLSKYCAYLVVFHPELLPDNKEKTESVFEDMKAELKSMIGCPAYFLSSKSTRVKRILESSTKGDDNKESAVQREIQVEMGVGQQSDHRQDTTAARGHSDQNKVVLDGAKLGKLLMDEVDHEIVWKVLADVWTELIVYAAASNDEECVKGHQEVLVQGGEFITMLWALATHIGITRRQSDRLLEASSKAS